MCFLWARNWLYFVSLLKEANCTWYNETVGNIGNVVTPLRDGPRHYRRCSSGEYALEEPIGHLAITDTGASPVGVPKHRIAFSIRQCEAEEPVRKCTDDWNRTILLYCTDDISTAIGDISKDFCTRHRIKKLRYSVHCVWSVVCNAGVYFAFVGVVW
jgi:hypothetical protein